jgi:hypothetical protein
MFRLHYPQQPVTNRFVLPESTIFDAYYPGRETGEGKPGKPITTVE